MRVRSLSRMNKRKGDELMNNQPINKDDNDSLAILQYTQDKNLNKEENEKTLRKIAAARKENEEADVTPLINFKL